MKVDPDRLSDAIVLWTGWDAEAWPTRDDSRVVEAFGADLARDLLEAIRQVENEFYESDARFLAESLSEMGSVAAARFQALHPELRDDAIHALAWCYTYDFK